MKSTQKAGTLTIAVPKSVKKGRYRATVTATSAAGVTSAPLVRTVTVE